MDCVFYVLDFLPCQHCGKTFSAIVAEHHIPRCAQRSHQNSHKPTEHTSSTQRAKQVKIDSILL